jgi:hypothetical protein
MWETNLYNIVSMMSWKAIVFYNIMNFSSEEKEAFEKGKVSVICWFLVFRFFPFLLGPSFLFLWCKKFVLKMVNIFLLSLILLLS